MNNTIQSILALQVLYNQFVEELGYWQKQQFDIRVNLTLLRLSFRDSINTFQDLEYTIFEQDLEYLKLTETDSNIIEITQKLELLNTMLDAF
jgi:hypothetical protein